MDRIVIPRIPLQARVGVTEEERATPQDVTIGVSLYLDLSRAGASDAIADTVDYEAVCSTVVDTASGAAYHLIEAMAEDVADVVLKGFDVVEVEVRVEKPGALRAYGVPFAAAEIRRSRDG